MKIYPILLILTTIYCSNLQQPPQQQLLHQQSDQSLQQQQKTDPPLQQQTQTPIQKMASSLNGDPTVEMKAKLMAQIQEPLQQLTNTQDQLKVANHVFNTATTSISQVQNLANPLQSIISDAPNVVSNSPQPDTSNVVSNSLQLDTSNVVSNSPQSDTSNVVSDSPHLETPIDSVGNGNPSTSNTVVAIDDAQKQQINPQKKPELLIPNPKVSQQAPPSTLAAKEEKKQSPVQELELGPILPWALFPSDRMNSLLSNKEIQTMEAWPWRMQSFYNEAAKPTPSPFLYYLYSLRNGGGEAGEAALKKAIGNIEMGSKIILSITPPNPIVQEIDSIPIHQKTWKEYNEGLVKDHIIQILQGGKPITISSIQQGKGSNGNFPYHRMMAYELLLTIQMGDIIDYSLIKAGLTIQDRDLMIMASKLGLHRLLTILLGQSPPPLPAKGEGAPSDLQITDLQTLLLSAQFQPHSLLAILSTIPWEQREIVQRASDAISLQGGTSQSLLKMWLSIPDVALLPKGQKMCDGATLGVKEFKLLEDLLPSGASISQEDASLLGKSFTKWNFGLTFEESNDAIALLDGGSGGEQQPSPSIYERNRIPKNIVNTILRGYCMPKPVVKFI